MENTADKNPKHESCEICSKLSDKESGYQKFGGDNNYYLPEASKKLMLAVDLKPNSERKLQLLQCPECKTYYLYQTDYEYLVNGAEDDQDLIRLNDSQAAKYLEKK